MKRCNFIYAVYCPLWRFSKTKNEGSAHCNMNNSAHKSEGASALKERQIRLVLLLAFLMSNTIRNVNV